MQYYSSFFSYDQSVSCRTAHERIPSNTPSLLYSRNRLSPRFINKAPQPYTEFERKKMLGQQHKHTQHKRKKITLGGVSHQPSNEAR